MRRKGRFSLSDAVSMVGGAWEAGGALVEFHCSGTLDWLGAFLHASALE